MGKKLQNELWARPVASKLSERWPPTLFFSELTRKRDKNVQTYTPMPKFLRDESQRQILQREVLKLLSRGIVFKKIFERVSIFFDAATFQKNLHI